MNSESTGAEYAACKATGLWPLAWAVTLLEEKGLKIKAVTLRKYCEAGRLGYKIGGTWLVTDDELKGIASAPPETRCAGRHKKS